MTTTDERRTLVEPLSAEIRSHNGDRARVDFDHDGRIIVTVVNGDAGAGSTTFSSYTVGRVRDEDDHLEYAGWAESEPPTDDDDEPAGAPDIDKIDAGIQRVADEARATVRFGTRAAKAAAEALTDRVLDARFDNGGHVWRVRSFVAQEDVVILRVALAL